MRSMRDLVGCAGLLVFATLASGCELSLSSGMGDDEEGLGGRQTGPATGGRQTGGTTAVSEGGAGPVVEVSDGGEGGEYFSLTSVTINSSARRGEIALSGQLGIVEGELGFVLSSVKDPEDPTRPVDADAIAFAITVDGEQVECEVAPTGELQRAPVDIVFVNDTTGSMSGTVNGIADSISDFATSVSERGVDALFSMITYGDEFATFTEGEEAYTVGQAEYSATGVDSSSRAYVDLSELDRFQAFLTEVRDSDDLGEGGGDGPENTLGALDFALEHLSWRPGAARVVIAICDDAAHMADDGFSSSLESHFVPPEIDDLLDDLDGTAVVHVVGNDIGEEPYYNIKGLSDETGGAFIDLPEDGIVDLSSTTLNEWVGSTFFGVCFSVPPGDRELVIDANVTGGEEHSGSVAYDITLR
ncbi:MAG: VWA domain-containing protein [Polyangiaceae bacterium]|nr:VWA domain-containing protein [Polyangiaceae bacterium]